MTYNPVKPDTGPSPMDDASIIQTNFAQFATLFALNHIALNLKGQGNHSTVILENQTSDPGVDEDLVALYNKDATSAASTEAQLFFQIKKFLPTSLDTTKAPNVGMQLTYNKVDTTGPVYQSFLPGGYILYFGNTTVGSTVTLVPTPTKILCTQAFSTATGNIGGSTNVPFNVWATVTQPDKVQINSSQAPGGTVYVWMAIAQA